MLHNLVCGSKSRKDIPSKCLPLSTARYLSWIPRPFKSLATSCFALKSSQSEPLLNLDFSFLLLMFQLPVKKSKSFADDVFDGIIFRPPFASTDAFTISLFVV